MDLLQSKIDILQIEYLIHRSWYMILLKNAGHLTKALTIFMHKYEVIVLPFTCGYTVVFHAGQAEKHSFPEWQLHPAGKLSIG